MLGRISGLFGVLGWVRVFSYTEPREAILRYRCWQLAESGGWRRAALEAGQRHGKGVVARLAGCEDRDAAAALVGCDIGVERDELPALEDDRYYWADLQGMQVVNRDGTELGNVDGLLETGANDVLVVRGTHERLIPFVMHRVILGVDVEKRVIRVDWEWD